MIQPVDNDKCFVKKTKQRSVRNNKQKLPHHKKSDKNKRQKQQRRKIYKTKTVRKPHNIKQK